MTTHLPEGPDPRSDWRALRERAGISIRALEAKTGINRGTLSSIETGRVNPSPSECWRILQVIRPEHPGAVFEPWDPYAPQTDPEAQT